MTVLNIIAGGAPAFSLKHKGERGAGNGLPGRQELH